MRILKDNICVWDNAMSREWCDNLIALTDAKIAIAEDIRVNEKEGSTNCLAAGVTFCENKKRIDTSLVLENFESLKETENELLICLEECLNDMREHYRQFSYANTPHVHWCEKITCKVQRTPPGGGFSEWHYEQGSGIGECARRWGVWMLYLNDVEKGGKTDFPAQGLSVTPKAGTMVIWPAAYTHPHRSAPDLEDWKYIVTGWLQYHIEGESIRPQAKSRL